MKAVIDWSQPWFRSVRSTEAEVLDAIDWKSAFNRQSATRHVCNDGGFAIQFVEQNLVAENAAYEKVIHETGKVPTRDNLHDFFNALVWLSFPCIKRQLNAMQAEQISRMGIGASRGRSRDAATLFDENAALLIVRKGARGGQLLDALRDHQWQTLFLERRQRFIDDCDVWLFGHALMEKLVNPYKSITAHAWAVWASDEFFIMPEDERREWLDACVAQQLQQEGTERLKPLLFTPLPVLGIPGWWPSQDIVFYSDEKVFRPKRSTSC